MTSSRGFAPLEIPPGVVATPTKNMRSSNYSEVNMVRWESGRLAPIGGQSAQTFTFASRCRLIHPWYDLDSRLWVAYICENNIYVDGGSGSLVDITPADGLNIPPTVIGGYGTYTYSYDTYGTPRDVAAPPAAFAGNVPPMWSADNFGALLMVMYSTDGRLLQWDPAVGGLMTKVEGSPIGRCFVVTAERFIMMFGLVDLSGGGPRRFGWCDQEHPNDWSFTDVASKAGFYDVEPASPIITAVAGQYGVMFWTSKKAYFAYFEGLPYIYGYRELADGTTPWSPLSRLATSNQIVWMSQQGPYTFDGTSIVAVPCPVRTWINNDIDMNNVRDQAVAVHLTRFSEFWWFFPGVGQQYNTKATIYNYRENWWSQARMPRSAGVTASYVTPSYFADGLNAYTHEQGLGYTNAELPWAETFDLNISSGAKLTHLKQMMPDLMADDPASIKFRLIYRMSRSNTPPTGLAAESAVNGNLFSDWRTIDNNGYLNFRTTGRDIRMRMEVVGPVVSKFTLGQHLVDAVDAGAR